MCQKECSVMYEAIHANDTLDTPPSRRIVLLSREVFAYT